MKPPAFQFYAREWLSSTATLSLAAQGAYMRFLAWSWDNGPLPASEKERARLVGLTAAAFRRVWSEFSLKWVEVPGGLINRKLEEKRAEQHTHRQRRIDAGRSGADRRWQTHSNAIGNAISEVVANDSSASASASATEDQDQNPTTALTFPCDGSVPTYQLTEQQLCDWQAAYPNLDVIGECSRARAWVLANPGKRKTAAGMPKFLVGWLNRVTPHASGQKSHTYRPAQMRVVVDWQSECAALHDGRCGNAHFHAAAKAEAS